ncbi:MAG: NAD(P)/FAD-dependent oxidoreductase [Bacteroidia bacterium]
MLQNILNYPQHIAILGGGLAGSFLAARLLEAGHQVSLIDDGAPRAASRVAAGLFNVITGRFGAKSWLAETLLAEIEAFFAQPAYASLRQHIHYSEIYRPFKTFEEYNKWTGKAADPAYAEMVVFQETPLFAERIINPHGGIRILPCGWLETGAFIDDLHRLLQQNDRFSLIRERIDYEAIGLAERSIQTASGKLQFDRLVFAEGPALAQNPYLSFLKLIPNKGEILILHAPELQLPYVVSKKVYLIPLGEDRYLTGSTYRNQFEHAQPTDEGKAEIETHLEKLLKVPYEIVDHFAGIRPTTPNRRPIVGIHPDFDYVYVLSGFGTKGVLLAPYTSKLLAQGICENVWQMPNEMELSRFIK